MVITDLSFLPRLKLLPCLLLDHSRISIQVLPLQLNLFKFLCKALFFVLFVCFFLIDVFISLNQSLFSNLLFLFFQGQGVLLLLFPPIVILMLALDPSSLNRCGIIHKQFRFFFFFLKVNFSFKINILLAFTFVEL